MMVLIGKSCSGKDTVVKELKKMGYESIVTYTTRLMRENEIDGVNYHFVSQEIFNSMISNNEFAEWKSYETENGTWMYGNRIIDYTNGKKVILLTPDGYEKIQKFANETGISLTAIYLKVSNKTLKKRMKNRDVDIKESKRRYKADKRDFRHIEDIVDYIVINENRDAFETALICKEMDEIKERYHKYREY